MVSLEMACNLFLCFLVKGFTGIFPDLVRDNTHGFCLKACLSLLDCPMNLLALWIIDVARSDLGSLISTSSLSVPIVSIRDTLSGCIRLPDLSKLFLSWAADGFVCSADICSAPKTDWYTWVRVRRFSICETNPSVSPIIETIHQTLCATKMYWCFLA